MEWDLFFEENDGNQWPDSEIIKHFIRLIKRNKIDREEIEVYDFGCGSGNNIQLYLSYCDKVNCIDFSEKALHKLKKKYSEELNQGLINLLNINLNDTNLSFLEKINLLKKIFIDCTCFQHLKTSSRETLLSKLEKFSKNNKFSYLISKSLCFESSHSGIKTNIINKSELLDFYSRFGKILDKSYSIIEENDLRQEFLTLTINFNET